ncbi:acyl-CoA N-acyltransferase [Hypoxylon trugodes]|uniref:acyl-CoA N-acyltransferase n=1 Tax=Hypoxylon trugodes TaxID=326681 RepID=UPI00219F5069|nr:acyl-CoA N-acyltransferase [Hypoxylon trugodes]KAI1391664.1 acyl-CoA N-acyltransferase [Hypoxylon trugodes]
MSKDTIQFRVATTDDAPQLQGMVQSAFRAVDVRQNWTADMELNARFRIDTQEIVDKITNPDSAILIATDVDDAAMACCQVVKRNADLARFAMFAVDQQYQRRGLGRYILAYVEDYCRQTLGARRLDLDALSTREELIAWYERCGYVKTGETTPFPYERIQGIALAEGLRFIILEKDLIADSEVKAV